MPNWCETHITFYANEGGEQAIQDFHRHLMEAQTLYPRLIKNPWSYDRDLWLVDVATYYGVYIDVTQRGYFEFIQPDVTHNSFQVTILDAWGPNIAFWVMLLGKFYGNKIGFLYQAAEPGMGIYVTNDQGLLPRYNLSVHADNVDELLTLDRLFIKDGPFWFMGDDHEGDFWAREGGWFNYRNYPDNEDGSVNYRSEFMDPCVYYYDQFEGDDDECLGFLDDLTSRIENVDSIESVSQLPISVDSYIYENSTQAMNGQIYGDLLIDHIANGDTHITKEGLDQEVASKLENSLVHPIMDSKDLFIPADGSGNNG
jgi:hypothetical protein